MNFTSLEEIFSAFNQMKVLIIGDVMIDSYVWGKVERISPEAPVPIIQVKKKEKRLGGAANVAKNIQSLGAKPILCSVIGNDLEGNHFIDLLNQRKIVVDGIVRSSKRITTVKERILSGSQHILRVDEEELLLLDKKEETLLLDKIASLLPSADAIIFEDYDKGVLNKNIIETTIKLAHEHQVPTIVDPKKKNFNNYSGASLFKPNLKEIQDGTKIDLDEQDMDSLENVVTKLRKKLNLQHVMVTLSEKGVYISSTDSDHHIPAHIRSISDVSGAGDTVVSIAGLCMGLKLPPKFTAALSNLGGGLVCEHLGVVSVDKEMLFKEASENGLSL